MLPGILVRYYFSFSIIVFLNLFFMYMCHPFHQFSKLLLAKTDAQANSPMPVSPDDLLLLKENRSVCKISRFIWPYVFLKQFLRKVGYNCSVLLSSDRVVIFLLNNVTRSCFCLFDVFFANDAVRELRRIPPRGIIDILRRIPGWVCKQCFVHFSELQRAGEC